MEQEQLGPSRPVTSPLYTPGRSTTASDSGNLSQPEPVIFVVDDDAYMREALAGLIAASNLRVECFASAHEFLRRAAPEVPSCLVLDVRMPDLGGFELQHALAAEGRDLPVIFITGHADIRMAVRAMKAGAVEFLPKPVQGEDLLTAIAQALERDRQTRAQRAELRLLRQRRARLTQREFEVMRRIAQGKLNKQVAAEFGRSENTIKAHRRRIMEKMGAKSFAELVAMIERLL
jgi:FixJ family two-component response regulator